MFKETFDKQRQYFRAGGTRSLEGRLALLKKLEKMLGEGEGDFLDALKQDLGKSPQEAFSTEILPVQAELRHTMRRLRRWMRPVRKRGSLLSPFTSYAVRPEPKGQVLIIAPFNYPVQLSLMPLISVLAAGDTAILKVSEHAPTSSEALLTWIGRTFGEEMVFATDVPPEDFGDLLNQPYDHIFFTGSTRIGRKVMEQAARNLSSLTLELGGKSPVLVHSSADLPLAARRIAWGKWLNAGQSCIAPDYILVEEGIRDDLVEELKKAIVELYPEALANDAYPGLINPFHFRRVLELLDGEEVLYGGGFDESRLRIEPTLVLLQDGEGDLAREEVFGPILPIRSVKNLEEAKDIVMDHPDPLSLYVFARDEKYIRRAIREIPSGGTAVNDVLVQFLSTSTPFGGRGASGIGRYHGWYGFEAFSHFRTIARSSTLELPLRYPPYDEKGLKRMKFVSRLFYRS